MVDPVAWYDANAVEVAAKYDALASTAVHGWLHGLLPQDPGTVLDVGAGSGRDAAWFASMGHEVVAVEPSASMRKAASSMHPDPGICWMDDRLPELGRVTRSGLSFDLILLSAVWMHVTETNRPRAFRKLINLLKPGGLLAITLRCGSTDRTRGFHPVSAEEVETLARNHGALVERHTEAKDLQGRDDIRWIQMAIRLPDDGTGALPLLRHVILNDEKRSTYKLALLRTLCRMANDAAGLARNHDDDFVAVPLGLVALTWIRLFRPLLSESLPQSQSNIGMEGLGFVKEAFRRLAGISNLDLRVGTRFSGGLSADLHKALGDAASTIKNMPATHVTYNDGGQVFPVTKSSNRSRPTAITLDREYLYSFGEMLVPRHLWQTLQRFGVWIEPAVVAEWCRLIKIYAAKHDTPVEDSVMVAAMTWEDPNRDVKLVRQLALKLSTERKLYCVWSGKALHQDSLDVDHCLPWTVWPCGDLWNLMPAHRTVNQKQKKALLPSDRLLRSAQDRVLDWWGSAYLKDAPAVSDRFWLEANASLPGIISDQKNLADIFDAVCLQRMRLRHDQQVPEWAGDKYLSTP